MSDAEGVLRAAIEAGPWPVTELRGILKEAGFTDWQIRRAAASLVSMGELVLVTRRFWVHSSFLNEERGSAVYIEGHSRAELIRRVASRTPQPSGQRTATTEELMQGDGAERLAREAYAREWR
jgi:hypothetical protein